MFLSANVAHGREWPVFRVAATVIHVPPKVATTAAIAQWRSANSGPCLKVIHRLHGLSGRLPRSNVGAS
jgi:hypothetical protein